MATCIPENPSVSAGIGVISYNSYVAYVAKSIGPGWGFDCSQKLSPAQVKSMVATPLPNGQKVSFIFRYVSLNPTLWPGDIDPIERDSILGQGVPLLLVQHVNYPGWTASGWNGAAHGNQAGLNAKQIDYPAGAMIFVDMEGIADSGGPVYEYLQAWAEAVAGFGYVPAMYQGYACGMTPDLLAQHTEIGGWWSDFGARPNPTGVGFMCKQFAQVMHCNVPVDPDKCYADMLGRTLVGMSTV